MRVQIALFQRSFKINFEVLHKIRMKLLYFGINCFCVPTVYEWEESILGGKNNIYLRITGKYEDLERQ